MAIVKKTNDIALEQKATIMQRQLCEFQKVLSDLPQMYFQNEGRFSYGGIIINTEYFYIYF